MGNTLSKGSLFPAQLTNEMFNLVRGKSSLARLSKAVPLQFNGNSLFTFNMDSEVDLVGENGAKSNGGASIAPVTMQPVKIEYGVRVSDEFRYASEEIQLNYLRAFAEGFASKTARGLDIMAMHGVNPRTGLTASVLTNRHFDDLVTTTITYNSAAPQDNVTAAIAAINALEHDVTGLAAAPAFKAALANVKTQTGSNVPLFPNLGWGSNVSEINGLPFDSNSTVSFSGAVDRAIIGNFADFFRWGYAREIPIEVIEYGNPDNSDLGDLKGHNQVYIRGEAYIGWGIIVPEAFERIIYVPENPSGSEEGGSGEGGEG
jgi:hypothetical protein